MPKDPVTGDNLTRAEYVSWLIQGVIRRWTFLIGVSVLTVLIWATNNPVALLWWNLCASYLAIFIESVVGLAMFNQTRRDAVLIRHISKLEEQNNLLEEQNHRQLDRIDALLEHAKTGILPNVQEDTGV